MFLCVLLWGVPAKSDSATTRVCTSGGPQGLPQRLNGWGQGEAPRLCLLVYKPHDMIKYYKRYIISPTIKPHITKLSVNLAIVVGDLLLMNFWLSHSHQRSGTVNHRGATPHPRCWTCFLTKHQGKSRRFQGEMTEFTQTHLPSIYRWFSHWKIHYLGDCPLPKSGMI